MKPVSLSVLTLLVISALSASPTFAATIYVPTDQPTIQAGIDAAVDGDLVLVAPGTYIENIDFLGKAITVRSEAGAETTVIDGNDAGSVVWFNSGETENSVLESFTIRNGNSYDGGGVFCGNSTSPKITNCTILGNRVDHNGGGISCYSSATINNCVILENYARYSGGGIGCWDGATPSIINCLIFGNTTDNKGGGIFNIDDSSAMVIHCTISANTATYGAGIYSGGARPTITNCIVWENHLSEIWATGSPTPIVTFSNIEGGYGGVGNIDADPLFIGDGDYHLYLSSPCVDSGTDAGVYEDIEGRTRPLRSGFDMGAYEYPDCVDGDGDGYGDPACGGYDCDDTAPEVYPGAEEVCTGGIDDDCDGFIDMDDIECSGIHIPTDYPTIQAGIDAANDGILILVAPGTYVENVNFRGKALTLRSEAGVEVTVIDANQSGSAVSFTLGESTEAILDGFTITNGNGSEFKRSGGGAGILCSYSSPMIQNCIITGNEITVGGYPGGGGIGCYESSAVISNCLITENVCTGSDGSGTGGGIYCDQNCSLTITDCTVTRNRAGLSGGGIKCRDYSNITVENCTISENIAESSWSGGGGGIDANESCYPIINNCTISDNFATDGAGISCRRSPLTITDSTISGNLAYASEGADFAHGGGIYCGSWSDLLMTNCIVSGNMARGAGPSNSSTGGGINLYGTSNGTIKNCLFIGNSAITPGSGDSGWNYGGGVYVDYCQVAIENCTFAGNVAGARGGGVYYWDRLPESVTNCIFWGNSAPYGPQIAINDRITLSVSYSDVQGGETGVYVGEESTLSWLEGNLDEEPLFMGGGDYRLIEGSPCIDAGNPDPSYNDACFPPSMGTASNDMGAFGGPDACGWCAEPDRDGDGYVFTACGGFDCDDLDALAFPGAEETCDGKDTNCDGLIPEDEADSDRDMWMVCEEDCDDSDPDVYPGAEEICDGKDSDCDGIPGADEKDGDSDGYMICEGDCDDGNPAVNPDVEENCFNGIDDDCDALIDLDDPECAYTLELEVDHEASRLYLDFTLGAPTPTYWSTYFISLVFPTQVIPLWTVSLPTIKPPVSLPIDFYFPWSGGFFVYSALITLEGMQAYDLAWGIAGEMD